MSLGVIIYLDFLCEGAYYILYLWDCVNRRVLFLNIFRRVIFQSILSISDRPSSVTRSFKCFARLPRGHRVAAPPPSRRTRPLSPRPISARTAPARWRSDASTVGKYAGGAGTNPIQQFTREKILSKTMPQRRRIDFLFGFCK